MSEAPSPSVSPDEVARQELGLLIDQARWLIGFHDARGESISQRAVAILGFTGVIFALIPTAMALPRELSLSWGIWVSLAVTMLGLLATAIMSVIALQTREVGGPSIVRPDRYVAY